MIAEATTVIAAMLGLFHRFNAASRQQSAENARRIENALRASEARLSDVLNMSPEGIVLADEFGTIAMFSVGAVAMFGYEPGELIGRSVATLMPQRYLAEHTDPIQSLIGSPSLDGKMGERAEVLGLRKNGEEFPMEVSLSKYSTPDGIGVTMILRDIAGQQAAHEELLNAKLEAEEASRGKSRFIANMSHELRTPLNAILGFSELLMSPKFAERREEYAKVIHQSGAHLLNLINDILDLAKIEAGGFSLNETIIDFRFLVISCLELMGTKALTGKLEMREEIPTDLPPISGDERALKQILLNLLSNAVKFTPAGGSVTVFARLEGDGKFAFGVDDTGVGIAEDEQSRVFDRFGQGRHDMVVPDKGTGLGLSIVRGLAIAHGGRVALASRVGVGTRITITLPASRAHTAPAP